MGYCPQPNACIPERNGPEAGQPAVMSSAAERARLAAGILGLVLGLAAWSAAAESGAPGMKPGLAAAPLPGLKPDRSADEARAPGLLARLDFAPQEMELTQTGQETLAKLAERLKREPEAGVAIVAYAGAGAAATSARRISLGRALAVRSYLIERGIARGRMTVQAFEASAGGGQSERVDILWPPR
ncbi:MAG TPA: OmpA family protein [Vicinamibacteria bacterium]|nr:OmpA family protein [Vicinamibacteria bacterium]